MSKAISSHERQGLRALRLRTAASSCLKNLACGRSMCTRRPSGGHQARPRRPAARPTAGAAACSRGQTATRCSKASCIQRTVCLPVHDPSAHKDWQSLAPAHRVIVTPLASGICEILHRLGPRQLECTALRHLQAGASEAACGILHTWKVSAVWCKLLRSCTWQCQLSGILPGAEAGQASVTTWRVMSTMPPYRDWDTRWRTCTAWLRTASPGFQ